MQEFVKSLQRIDEAIQTWQKNSHDKYSHIEKSDIDKVYKILTDKQKWYNQTAARLNTLRSHEDPPVLCSQIQQEKDVSIVFIERIFDHSIFLDTRSRMLGNIKQTKTESRTTKRCTS